MYGIDCTGARGHKAAQRMSILSARAIISQAQGYHSTATKLVNQEVILLDTNLPLVLAMRLSFNRSIDKHGIGVVSAHCLLWVWF